MVVFGKAALDLDVHDWSLAQSAEHCIDKSLLLSCVIVTCRAGIWSVLDNGRAVCVRQKLLTMELLAVFGCAIHYPSDSNHRMSLSVVPTFPELDTNIVLS